MCIYVNIYMYMSSLSCHAVSIDFPDSPSPFVSIIHHIWQIL